MESLELPFFQLQVSKDIVEGILRGDIFILNANKAAIREYEGMPSCFFADIRQSDSSHDIRTAWEPARLQHIMTLMAFTHFSSKQF